MQTLKRSSSSSPVCRLPSQRPVSIVLLCGIYAVSVLCLIQSAIPLGVVAVLAAVSALYIRVCIKRIQDTEAYQLVLAADGQLCLSGASGQQRIEALRWQDFGYLTVLHCRQNAQPAVHFWWRHRMTAGQRRTLQRIIRISTNLVLEKPPSLIVNPLL